MKSQLHGADRPRVPNLGRTAGELRFRPNPSYRPPSHVEEVLTGMQGDLLLDAVRYRIASIDGTLFREVGFGGAFSAISIEAGISWFTRRRSRITPGKFQAWA